jgi:RHS repeat-associated protein
LKKLSKNEWCHKCIWLSQHVTDTEFYAHSGRAREGLIHNDHLATPQKMTDSSGTVVWSADYKPFGESTVTISTITNNLRFPGQYFDAEAGMHYNYFRDYNPAIGRYIEGDPIGLEGGINPFIYTWNNPINLEDLFGLEGAPPKPPTTPKPPPTIPTIPPPPKPPMKTPKPPGMGCNAMFRVCMEFCKGPCPGGLWGKGACAVGCTLIWISCVSGGSI